MLKERTAGNNVKSVRYSALTCFKSLTMAFPNQYGAVAEYLKVHMIDGGTQTDRTMAKGILARLTPYFETNDESHDDATVDPLNSDDLAFVSGNQPIIVKQDPEVTRLKEKRGFVKDMSHIDNIEMRRIELAVEDFRKKVSNVIVTIQANIQSVNEQYRSLHQKDSMSTGSYHLITKKGIRSKADTLVSRAVELRNTATKYFELGLLPSNIFNEVVELINKIIEWSKTSKFYYREWKITRPRRVTQTGYIYETSFKIDFSKHMKATEKTITIDDLVERHLEEYKKLRQAAGAVDKEGNVDLGKDLLNNEQSN